MSDEVLQRLDALRAGQAELRAGQTELRAGQAELRAGQDALRTELLAAVGESNEAILQAIRALHISHQETRQKVRAAG